MRRLLLLLCLISIPVILIGTGDAKADSDALSAAAFGKLRADYPLVSKFENEGYVTRLFGRPFGYGATVEAAALNFKNEYAAIFKADAGDLYPVSLLPDGRHTLPLMYDKSTDSYKFTLVYFSQFRDNIPVFKSDLRLLVLNRPDNPVVLASSGLRDLGDFAVPAGISPDRMLAENAAKSFYPGLVNFTEPRMVIWAGIEDMVVRPALGMEIIADNGKTASDDFEKWLIVINAQSGDILYTEEMIQHVDINGSVSGMATQGIRADMCDDEAVVGLPYARVYVQGESPVFADENGNFVIPHGGSSPVTVYSHLRGQWFRVFNAGGANGELSTQVTPPGPVNFLHNEDNSSQFNRAEVNAYRHSNVVRDFTLSYNPEYPVIYQQQEFRVNVNLNQSCNAYYDGQSINFFGSGGGCPNTAFSTVVHHEYGHHLVNVAGSQQGAYGEGMGDVVGMLITDNPGLAFGFLGDCNQPLRSGDNNFQFPCSGEIHYCGQLLSGSVWSTRNALLASYPDTYLDIISGLAINAMLLHRSAEVDPSITIDYLTVDDDDGNMWNGTPHAVEIIQGFVREHNMDFGVAPQIEHTPLIDNEDSTEVLGVDASVFTFFSMDDGTVNIHYSIGGDYQTAAMVNTSGSAWHGEIPHPPYGTTVSYYIEAIDDSDTHGFSPADAPDSVYSFYFGADMVPPAMELLEFPQNTVNLFGPYGPFTITASDVHGINQSSVHIHYRVNDETESELALNPAENDEFSLEEIDLGRRINSGDIVHCYFTAYDQADTPNQGRLPQTGSYELLMSDSEIFENFEEFGVDRWSLDSDWHMFSPGYNGGNCIAVGPGYPNNADTRASMDFGYNLSPYTHARVTFFRKNILFDGDTCMVEISNDGGNTWVRAGAFSDTAQSYRYQEYDISSVLDPNATDYRARFHFVSNETGRSVGVFVDDIGWAIGQATEVDDHAPEVPDEFSLNQNYPNPFNPQTNISFVLPRSSAVRLEIYDLLGRRIALLADDRMPAGNHNIVWDGTDFDGNHVSSGIYFYMLSTEYGDKQAKMTLLK